LRSNISGVAGIREEKKEQRKVAKGEK